MATWLGALRILSVALVGVVVSLSVAGCWQGITAAIQYQQQQQDRQRMRQLQAQQLAREERQAEEASRLRQDAPPSVADSLGATAEAPDDSQPSPTSSPVRRRLGSRSSSVAAALDGAVLVAQDRRRTFLGSLTSHYDDDSIFNRYGDYGSQYSDTCIWNEYSEYGSRYGRFSPYNPYCDTPPMLLMGRRLLAYVTVNRTFTADVPVLDPGHLLAVREDF